MKKLLLVDDSALMRRLLGDIFNDAGDFVIEIARNGAEALDKLEIFQPDVITLDIHMPGMDGLACLDAIMLRRPTPVVMVSALTADGANETLEAMALGALDFIPKPRGAVSLEIDAIADMLVDKVRAAANARISRTTRLRDRVRAHNASYIAPPLARRSRNALLDDSQQHPPIASDGTIVLVGCSTGGPPALDAVIGALPADYPYPVVVAQHMPASFTGALARRLDRACAVRVCEVDRTMTLSPGCVYIGRGDADIILSRRGEDVVVMPAPLSTEYHWHPSVDRLVESALRHVIPHRLIGVLMTGMGADGASAMAELHRLGGHTIAEAEATAVVWGMPGALVARGGASSVCPLDAIADELCRIAA